MLPARFNRDQRQRQGLSRYGSDYDVLDAFIPTSPWQMMRRMQEDMDRLFGQIVGQGGGREAGQGGQGLQTWAPHMDVSETEQEYHIEVDLPGVCPDDIDIQVQEGQLTLRATMQQGDTAQESQSSGATGTAAGNASDGQSSLQNSQTGQQTGTDSSGQPTGQQSGTADGQQSGATGGQQTGRQVRRYHQRERRFGYFERVMTLPPNVDENNIRAEFRHGVLMLRLPKQQPAATQGRRIPIAQTESSQGRIGGPSSGSQGSLQSVMSGQQTGGAGTASSGQQTTQAGFESGSHADGSEHRSESASTAGGEQRGQSSTATANAGDRVGQSAS